MDLTTVIVAIVGVGGTLAAAIVGPRLQVERSAHLERIARHRELCMGLYLDAITYAQELESYLVWLTDDIESRRPTYGDMSGLGLTKQITARMRLLVPARVRQAWDELVMAYEVLYWNRDEDTRDYRGEPFTVEDDMDVVRVRTAITALLGAMRRDLGLPAD